MRVSLPDHEVVPVGVPLAPLEAVDEPGGDPDAAKHDRQRRREVLAVARSLDEQELVDRFKLGLPRERERVTVRDGQKSGEALGGVVRAPAPRADLPREVHDPGRERRELQIAVQRASVEGRRFRVPTEPPRRLELRVGEVPESSGGGRHGHAVHVVRGDRRGPQGDPQKSGRREDDVGADRLQVDLLGHEGARAPIALERELAARGPGEHRALGSERLPAAAVEVIERDAPPAQVRQGLGRRGAFGEAHAHHHARVALDLPEGPKVDVVGEARHHGAQLRAKGQRRLAHAGDDDEEHGRDREGGGGGRQRETEERGPEPPAARHRRRSRRPDPLGLAQHVMEHERPHTKHQERQEDAEEREIEGHRRRGHQHEEREEAHVAGVPERPPREEAVEQEEEQQAHEAVEQRGRQVEQVDRGGPGGDHDRRLAEAAERAELEPVAPPAGGEGAGGERGAGHADEAGEEQGEEAVHREQIGRDPEGAGRRHEGRTLRSERAGPVEPPAMRAQPGPPGAAGPKRAAATPRPPTAPARRARGR